MLRNSIKPIYININTETREPGIKNHSNITASETREMWKKQYERNYDQHTRLPTDEQMCLVAEMPILQLYSQGIHSRNWRCNI